MKVIIAILLVVASLISVSSAELLITANPLGKGKWGGLISYLSDSNLRLGAATGITAASLGGYAGYGLTDKLDLFVQSGQMTYGSLPAGVTSVIVTAAGVTAKYTLIEEGASSPVSAALGVGSKILSSETKIGGATTTANGNQSLIGVGVSKVIVPFVPYAGLLYRTTGGSIANSTQLDLTVGTVIAWSLQGAIFAEYTLQSITPSGASSYTANQIGLGVGYRI